MNAKYFLDTNIIVYSFDNSQTSKKERAHGLIKDAIQNGNGIISTQVIQEFLNVATRKFAVSMKQEDCKGYLKMILSPLCKVYPDQALYEESLEVQQETKYSFYDALIITSALRGGCEILYSEDFQSGQEIRELRIINPFNSEA